MKKKYIVIIMINFIRMFFLKKIKKSFFYNKIIQLISLGTTFDIQENGKIVLEGRIHTETNTVISAKNGIIKLGNNIYLNRNSMIICREEIIIGDGCTIGPNVCIYDHDHDITHPGKLKTKKISIGKNVWIGAGCIILKGVEIGDDSIIAAGTIVVKSVSANTIIRNKIENIITEKKNEKNYCNSNSK